MDRANQQKGRRGPVVLALFIATAMLLTLTSSASALTLGIGWVNPANNEPEMPIVAKSGAQAFRVVLPPTNDNDGTVRAASESGVTILANVSAEYPEGLPVGENRKIFMEKLYQEVRRYGDNGSFWTEPGNTGLPKKPITTWEIWNEPNLHGVDAAAFGKFVSEAADKIQQASIDQAAHMTTVLSGGLLAEGNVGWGKNEQPWSYTGAMAYLQTAYAEFGSNANVTGVAIHPYEINDQNFINGTNTTRIQAFEYAVSHFHTKLAELANGGPQKSMWITETGWPVGGEHQISEADQAAALRQVVNYLWANEASLNVKDLIWYNLRDLPSTDSNWANWCGLRDHAGNFRPSWTAFQEKAGVAQVIPQAPTVTTTAATSVRSSQATLNGTVNPGNLPTTYRFEYGTTTNFGSSVTGGSAGEGGSAVASSVVLKGLQPNTTYYYRIVASNAIETRSGATASFQTPNFHYSLGTSNGGGLGSWNSIISTKTRPTLVRRGDWNGDGKSDLVAFELSGSSSYRIMLGISNGSGIGPWTQIGSVTGVSGLPARAAVGDWNGDGKADLIATETTSASSYRIMLGTSNGAGLGTWGQIGSVTGVSGPPAAIGVGDWNGDGKADLIATESTSASSYRIMLGTSNGSGLGIWNNIGSVTGVSGPPAAIGVGDWNGDGKADLLAIESASASSYRIMLGTSNGAGLGTWSQIGSVTGVSGPPAAIGVGDWTGDGKADLVATESTSPSSYRIMLGTSNGSGLGTWSQIGKTEGVSGPPAGVGVGDWNSDGKADLLTTESTSSSSYRIMLGTSNGSGLGTWSQIGKTEGVSGPPAGVGVGDWNGDGKADLLALESTSPSSYRIMLGTSNGSGLGTWSKIGETSGWLSAIAVGDFTGDKKADLIAGQDE